VSPQEQQHAEVDALMQLFFHTQHQKPKKGLTQWAFFTREKPISLSWQEAHERLKSGKGFYVSELAYDASLKLVNRGDGWVVHTTDELWKIANERVGPIFFFDKAKRGQDDFNFDTK
jgi:hypothetical protein